MWSTESGDRVLAGAERKVFKTAVGLLANWLEEFHKTGAPLDTRAPLFDSLSLEQKLAMLDHVSTALLREDVPAPKLTAIREATVGAVYHYLMDLVEIEIESNEMELRPLVLAAALERGLGETEDGTSDLPELASTRSDDWADVIDMLSMEILWDTDWDLPQHVLDMAPEQKRNWSREHAIDEDYFTDIALDPAPAELIAITSRLRGFFDGQ